MDRLRKWWQSLSPGERRAILIVAPVVAVALIVAAVRGRQRAEAEQATQEQADQQAITGTTPDGIIPGGYPPVGAVEPGAAIGVDQLAAFETAFTGQLDQVYGTIDALAQVVEGIADDNPQGDPDDPPTTAPTPQPAPKPEPDRDRDRDRQRRRRRRDEPDEPRRQQRRRRRVGRVEPAAADLTRALAAELQWMLDASPHNYRTTINPSDVAAVFGHNPGAVINASDVAVARARMRSLTGHDFGSTFNRSDIGPARRAWGG